MRIEKRENGAFRLVCETVDEWNCVLRALGVRENAHPSGTWTVRGCARAMGDDRGFVDVKLVVDVAAGERRAR
jgi:hypothetical protein